MNYYNSLPIEKAALQGGPEDKLFWDYSGESGQGIRHQGARTMERNEKNSSTIASDFQTTSESFQLGTSPLKGAFIHLCHAEVLLRRARAESLGHDRCECLNRLLQGVDCIGASIAWLGGGAPQGKVDPAIHTIDGDQTSAGALL